MGTRNLPILADFSDGDTSGPTRPAAAGDDLLEGLVTDPEYRVTGGQVYHDGTRFRQGFFEPADDTIHADWTAHLDPAGSSGSKSNGTISITIPAAAGSDWFGGVYTMARYEMPLPAFRRWEFWSPITYDVGDGQGGTVGVLFDDNDAQFVQMQRHRTAGPLHNIIAARGPNAIVYNAAVGAVSGWSKVTYDGEYVFFLYSNNAVGNEPGDEDWTIVGQYGVNVTIWRPVKFRAMIGALNIVGLPGCTVDFTRPRWRVI